MHEFIKNRTNTYVILHNSKEVKTYDKTVSYTSAAATQENTGEKWEKAPAVLSQKAPRLH